MRARTLAIPLVLVFLTAGCGGTKDDNAAGSASSASSGASGKPAAGAVGETPSPSPGVPTPDPMEDDNGAPGSPDPQGRQSVVFDRVPGNKSGSCVNVGDERDVKSGGFVGGAFDDARKSYGKTRPGLKPKQVRLYWVPAHAKPMKGVTVTATSGGKKVRVTQRSVADAEQWKFYDTLITLPTSGKWTFRVASGVDRGCFVATF